VRNKGGLIGKGGGVGEKVLVQYRSGRVGVWWCGGGGGDGAVGFGRREGGERTARVTKEV